MQVVAVEVRDIVRMGCCVGNRDMYVKIVRDCLEEERKLAVVKNKAIYLYVGIRKIGKILGVAASVVL